MMLDSNFLGICLVALAVLGSVDADREEGELLIGAVISISKTENGSCAGIDYEGLTVTEAIRFAIQEINKDDKLLGSLTTPRKLGYDIQDTCGSKEQEKDIAYAFNGERRNFRPSKPGQKKPVSAVIGKFSSMSVEAMKLLNFEEIPQVSYAPRNAKLKPDGLEAKDIKGLISVYPEEITKMKAVASVLQKLDVEYTTLISSNNVRGEKGGKLLQSLLGNLNMCLSDVNMAKNEEEIKKLVRKLKKKPLAKVVVLHCDVDNSMTAIIEAARLNMSDIIWVSTMSMKGKIDQLAPVVAQASGMIYIDVSDPDPIAFINYIESKGWSLLNESSWMQKAVKEEGGSEKCSQSAKGLTKDEKVKCDEAIKNVKKKILMHSKTGCYAIDAVYSIARGLQSMVGKKLPASELLGKIKSLSFQSPLTQTKVHFDADGQAISQSLVIHNIQGNLTLQDVTVGTWKRENDPSLDLDVQTMRFKQGRKKAPISKCSKDCIPGEEIIYPETGPRCCWTCKKCPNSTISNATNSKCMKCEGHQTANPQQSSCYQFKQKHMAFKNPVSEFTFFLITVALLFVLFASFIFNQNRDCEVMQMADNATMQGLLFGIVIVLASSIVLMLKPTFPACITYAALFNGGLTIILGALLTKTWLFRQLFYGSNEVATACCSRPGLFTVSFLLLIQAAILGLGFFKENVVILFDDTDRWDVKYIECSYFRGIIFWVSYGFNVLLCVLINFFNCGVPNVEARFGEYNWLCVTSCSYYAIAFLYILSFWAFPLLQKMEVGVVLTVLHCFLILLAYCYPKLHKVLFMHREEMQEIAKSERAELLYKYDEDDEEGVSSPVSGVDVFKNKVVQLNYEPENDRASSK